MLLKGKGVEKDYNRSLFWYIVAAEQGDGEAQNSVGILYELGIGTVQSLSEAFYWYTESSNSGYTPAFNRLAYFYLMGKGVDKDIHKAIELFKKAASKGDQTAIEVLDILDPEDKLGKGLLREIGEIVLDEAINLLGEEIGGYLSEAIANRQKQ